MFIWFIISIVAILTVFSLIFPLIFTVKSNGSNAEFEYDLNIYKDQLDEIEKDIERGVLSQAEYESAKNEISRRILSIESRNKVNKSQNNSSQKLKIKLVSITLLALLVPLLSMNIYYLLGNPSLPNSPFVKKTIKSNSSLASSMSSPSIEDSINSLKKRLEGNKTDVDGWILLGRSYLVTQSPDKAIIAFKEASSLRPNNKEIYSFIGEAIVFKNQGKVTDEAISNFTKAIEQNKNNPASRYYLSLAKAQKGNLQIAFKEWLQLAKDTSPETPWYPLLQKKLQETASALGIEQKNNIDSENNTKQPGPSQNDIDAASEMSPGDRNEMIRGMVENLAEKLKNNPNNIQGWEMLAKSYKVLGETEKAQNAKKMIEKLKNSNKQ